jgi:hypothetical protein
MIQLHMVLVYSEVLYSRTARSNVDLGFPTCYFRTQVDLGEQVTKSGPHSKKIFQFGLLRVLRWRIVEYYSDCLIPAAAMGPAAAS